MGINPGEQCWPIGASRQQRRWLAALHSLALIACWWNELALNYQLAATLAVLISAIIHGQRRNPEGVILKYSDAGGWRLQPNPDSEQTVTIQGSTWMTSWLIVLHIKTDDGRYQHFAIFNDALPADAYRRLTVALKIAGHATGA
jgi:hypothetical protein